MFNQLDKSSNTHDLLFLNNGFLVIRVSKFQKAVLCGKREFDFQIDIYCLKIECKSKLESLMCQTRLNGFQSGNFDIFWFSRFYLLFFENEFLAKLKELNDSWKNEKSRNKFNSDFVRKLRIMNYVAKEYFEHEKNSFKIRAQTQACLNNAQLHNNNGKNKSNGNDVEIPKSIITSANYYRSIFRELSLSIITPKFLSNIQIAITKFDACNSLEKSIVVIQAFFIVRKNTADEAQANIVTNFLKSKCEILNTNKQSDFSQLLKKLRDEINCDRKFFAPGWSS
jgi:hypothetical protein